MEDRRTCHWGFQEQAHFHLPWCKSDFWQCICNPCLANFHYCSNDPHHWCKPFLQTTLLVLCSWPWGILVDQMNMQSLVGLLDEGWWAIDNDGATSCSMRMKHHVTSKTEEIDCSYWHKLANLWYSPDWCCHHHIKRYFGTKTKQPGHGILNL